VADDQVRDELLVGGVLFGGRAGKEEIVGRIEKGCHVALRLEAKALEGSEAVENGAGDDKDIFFGGHGRAD
jgi:hypothetical protein